MRILPYPTILVLPFLFTEILAQTTDTIRTGRQNPSPMVETTRAHSRIEPAAFPGLHTQLTGIFPAPADIFVAAKDSQQGRFILLILFHAAPFIAHDASTYSNTPLMTVTLNLGSGSRVYGDAFENPNTFLRFRDTIAATVERHINRPIGVETIITAGFSAGYGAIRKILSTQSGYDAIDAVLLLDGIHASYIPDQRVLAEGGRIDSMDLAAFLTLATDASQPQSEKRFLITHSEIFPGTFASTTEATDFLF